MTSHQSLFKNTGYTLDRQRLERLNEADRVRRAKRDEELERLRQPDEGNEEIDIMDNDLFNEDATTNMRSTITEKKVLALRYYAQLFFNCSSSDEATYMARDMQLLGLSDNLMEALTHSVIDSEVCRHALRTLHQITSAIDDFDIIAAWIDATALQRMTEICDLAFLIRSNENVEMAELILKILNYIMPNDEKIFGYCIDTGMHLQAMEIFRQSFFNDIPELRSLSLRRLLLIFLSFFYNETLSHEIPAENSGFDDYIRLLHCVLRNTFVYLQSLKVSDMLARGQPTKASKLLQLNSNIEAAKTTESDMSVTNFLNDGIPMMTVAEEAVFSLSWLMDQSADKRIAAFLKVDFFDFLKLLLEYSDLFWAKFIMFGSSCRKSILDVFKSIFAHINKLTTINRVICSLNEVDLVFNLWDVLQNANRASCIGGINSVVYDLKDVDNDGTFEQCISNARDALASCLSVELENINDMSKLCGYVVRFNDFLRSGQYRIRKEALLAMRTVCVFGKLDIIRFAVEQGVIVGICDMLTVVEAEGVMAALECIFSILEKYRNNMPTYGCYLSESDAICRRDFNAIKLQMENEDIISKLEYIMKSSSGEAFNIATEIFDKHFCDEKVEDEEMKGELAMRLESSINAVRFNF